MERELGVESVAVKPGTMESCVTVVHPFFIKQIMMGIQLLVLLVIRRAKMGAKVLGPKVSIGIFILSFQDSQLICLQLFRL